MAVRIDSQADIRAQLDWRAGQMFIPMEPYTLPKAVASATRRFMDNVQLAAASLDFIVTPSGEHIFLEANPQGRFLWMEQRTGMPLLDVFCEYLIAGRKDFMLPSNRTRVCFSDFERDWEAGLNAAVQGHICVSGVMRVSDSRSVPGQDRTVGQIDWVERG